MKKGEKKKQQKALAKRKQRQTAHKMTRAAGQLNPQLGLIRQARKLPLLGCWAQDGWQEAGLTAVVVARRQPDGLITFGSYVVDQYCLGVKDAMARADVPYSRLISDLLPGLMQGAPVEISAGLAHELIYGSIEFAARWGFRPHRDFELAQLVLDPAGQHPPTGQVTFGRDGKPLYVAGPYDKTEAIFRQLTRTAGEGNFDYILTVGDPEIGDAD